MQDRELVSGEVSMHETDLKFECLRSFLATVLNAKTEAKTYFKFQISVWVRGALIEVWFRDKINVQLRV